MEETIGKRGNCIDDDDSKFLPPEICSEILSRLPADSAIECRRICKQWRSLIDHPSFIETHTNHVISSSASKKFGNYLIPNSSSSYFGCFLGAKQGDNQFNLHFVEYNDHFDFYKLVSKHKPIKTIPFHLFPFCEKWGILMMSSCNGLVFMGSSKPNYMNDMFVYNPFTREYLNLSLGTTTITEEEIGKRLKEKGYMTYGFGYLPASNEYKIVSLYYPDSGENGIVSVYTLGSGKWRNKGKIPFWVYNVFHPGFFANGAIHWFTNTTTKHIVTFDLAEERFRMIVPLPPGAPPSAVFVDELGVLGGCLCVTRSYQTRCENCKDIWVLNINIKEDGEELFSWNKRFSIPWKALPFGAKPQVILKSGRVLFRGGTSLISCNPKTGAFNEDRQDIFCDHRFKVIPYAKSFVSLMALGEENAKYFMDRDGQCDYDNFTN